jgi:hypothetical protein
MKRLISAAAAAALLFVAGMLTGNAQGRTTFTGTVLTYGSGINTRTTTNPFTLRITGETSDAEAARLLNVLQNSGQDALLDAIKGEDLGSLTIGGRLAPRINVVRIDDAGDKKRIRVAFARWMSFAEIRGGYRTTDYPFSYMEIMIDPRTGTGDGTYIAAAKVRFSRARNEVEIEDFGTFPSRVMGVKMRGAPLP